MPLFTYIARDKNGERVTGKEEAATQDELIVRLQANDLLVINVTNLDQRMQGSDLATGPDRKKVSQIDRRKWHFGVKADDLVLFCRQLAILLESGVTILKSLDIISQQISSRRFYQALNIVIADMEQGLSFHDSLAGHPKIFSELWVNLVESGEASGSLAVVLNRLAAYLERGAEFKKRIISALIYPLILLSASLSALLFLTIKIIPTFAEMFQGFDMKLPLITVMLINASTFLRKFSLLIIVGLIGAGVAFKKYLQTKNGRQAFDRLKLKIPLLGEFHRSLSVERFSSNMATLVESGVPLLHSLNIAEQSAGNVVIAGIIRQIKESVQSGKSLSRPLAESGFFEPMVVQMVAIGEEIGELPNMFKRISVFFQGYVETFLTRIVSMFEPMILMFMGAIIALMVVGMFLPIFQLSQIGSKGG